MRLSESRTGARILAFGGYQPARVVTNDELSATVDTTDEWIRSRVGIASRRIAGPDETLADMAVAAGGKALAASGLSPGDIDLVIVATCTPEAPIPNTAAAVARRLGIMAPGAYDLNAACAGFCYALAAASRLGPGRQRDQRAGHRGREAVPVGRLDRPVDLHHLRRRGGRGGGRPGGRADDAPGIGPVVWGSDGDMADKIYIKDRELVHRPGGPGRCSGGPPPRCTRSPWRPAAGPASTRPS